MYTAAGVDGVFIRPQAGSSALQCHRCAFQTADLLCDSARLDDWMREVPSGATPASFTTPQPPERLASEVLMQTLQILHWHTQCH